MPGALRYARGMSRAAIVALLAAGCWTRDATRATSPVPDTARDVAVEWVTAMLAGDTTRAMQLSTVPFSFDRRRIETLNALRPELARAADKASRAHATIRGATVVRTQPLAASFAVPVGGMIVVQVTTSIDGIAVLVRPDPPRVVGFRD